jgi:hypothetical protein
LREKKNKNNLFSQPGIPKKKRARVATRPRTKIPGKKKLQTPKKKNLYFASQKKQNNRRHVF